MTLLAKFQDLFNINFSKKFKKINLNKKYYNSKIENLLENAEKRN